MYQVNAIFKVFDAGGRQMGHIGHIGPSQFALRSLLGPLLNHYQTNVRFNFEEAFAPVYSNILHSRFQGTS